MSKLAIHVVTWNGAKYLSVLLRSLQNILNINEVVFRFLDNGSTDNSVTILREWCDSNSASLIVMNKNIGFSGGHNRLYEQAREKYIALVNQDIVVDPMYFQKILEEFEADDKLGSASGVLYRMNVREDQNVIDSAGLGIKRNHYVYDKVRSDASENRKVFGVSAACSIYRKQALDDVAYIVGNVPQIFSDRFHSYKEDVDLGYRLQLAGWDSMVIADAKAWHERGIKTDDSSSRTNRPYILRYQSYRNHILFLQHTASFNWFSWTGILIIVHESIKLLWLLLREPAVLKAWREIFVLRSDTREKQRQNIGRTYLPNRIIEWYGK